MSERQPHPSVTEQQLLTEEVAVRERRPKWKFASFLVGATAVGASIGVMMGVNAGSAEKTEPRSEPSATAAATPGETSETSGEGTNEYPEILTTETFEFHLGDKTYDHEAFKAAAAIRVAEAPEAEQAVDAMIEQGFTNMAQSACNPEDLALYQEIAPKSDVGELQTLSERFYFPAYKEALFSDKSVNGASKGPMLNMLAELNERATTLYEAEEGGAPYKSQFEVIDKLHVTESNLYGQHEVAYSAVVNYSDNSETSPMDKTFILDGVLIEDKDNGTWELAGGRSRELNDFQKDKYDVA